MSNEIFLVTGSNKQYMTSILPYLESIEEHCTGLKPYLVCVNWDGSELFTLNLKKISLAFLTKEQAIGEPGNCCVQHGSFLDFIQGKNDDIIIFTDGDMVLQRPISTKELEFINNFEEGDVGVSYNESPDETLLMEARKLYPLISLEKIARNFLNDNLLLEVYNTGVIVARKITYIRLYNEYMKRWDEINSVFKHYARQQWLISFILGSFCYFKPIILPYSIHTHGCYALPDDAGFDKWGKLIYNNEIVLFRHHI